MYQRIANKTAAVKKNGKEIVKLRANAHVMENATHKCEYKHVCKRKCSYEPNNKMEL